jgi:hypothetical protein
MVRELFMALFIVSLVLTMTLWFGSGRSLDVRQVEASLAK